MRDATGRTVLGDFGTGVPYDDRAGVSDPQIAGTPLYLAPEVVEGRPATVRSDLYSVGVLLYFLVTGDYPVRGRTLAEIKRAHATARRVRLREARPDLPGPFVDIVEALIAADPDRRYGTTAEAEEALQTFLTPSVGNAQARPSVAQRVLGHRLAVFAFAGAIIVSAVMAGAVWRYGLPAVLLSVGGSASADWPGLSAGDWILVAGFANQTGEEELDGTIEAAVKRELEYSAYVRVAQPNRIEDSLLLLGRPPTALLDVSLGREVARRDGGIRALLTGSILKARDAYSVTLDIVNPDDGAVVASVSDTARFADILRTVRRQVLAMRERLGEPAESVAGTRRTLSDETLPALKALHWYAKAHALQFRQQQSVPPQESRPERGGISDPENQERLREVERLTRAALREDPGFAAAWALLGPAVGLQDYERRELAIQDAGGRGPQSYVERAMQLIDRATPGERYVIEGAVHNMRAGTFGAPDTEDQRRELEQAVSAFEALLVLQPDTGSVGILSNIYFRLGRPRDATIMTLRMAEARPRSVELNAEVANDLFGQGNFEAARRHAARVESAMSPVSGGWNPTAVAKALLTDAYIAWLRDDPREALRIIDRTADTADHLLPIVARELRMRLWSLYAALGRWRQALATIELIRPKDTRDPAYLATSHVAAIARGELLTEMGHRGELRRFAAAEWPDPLPPEAPPGLASRAEILIEAGLLDAAERDVAWFMRRPGWPGVVIRDDPIPSYYHGALELRRGRPQAAIALFEKAWPVIAHSRSGPLREVGNPNNPIGPTGQIGQFGSAKLAEALEAVGNFARAIEILEESGSNRIGNAINNTPNRWTRGRAQLARLYRKSGQTREAEAVEAQLLNLLDVADPDHPLLNELKARRSESGSRPLALNAGDYVVVADFANRTGEDVLDHTIAAAVKRELEYSDFLRVAQRGRVEDALASLDRPLATRLDRQLAQEVSLRDGGVRAFVAGSIAKARNEYEIVSDIVDPATRITLATLTDRAPQRSDVLAAVRRHTLRLRQSLGEPSGSIDRSRQVLERAPIPSLKSFHLYAQAVTTLEANPALSFDQLLAVERTLRDAVEHDPAFARAVMALARINVQLALRRRGCTPPGGCSRPMDLTQGERSSDIMRYTEQALGLAATATPPERYHIIAVYHHTKAGVPRDLETVARAASALEALAALQPDDDAVMGLLQNCYQALGRQRDAAALDLRLADARPRNAEVNARVAYQLLREGNVDGARRYGVRAESALSTTASGTSVRLLGAYISWLEDSPRQVLEALDLVAATSDRLPEAARRELHLGMWPLYAVIGRLRQAERTIDVVRRTEGHDTVETFLEDLAKAQFFRERGDVAGLRELAAARWRTPIPETAPTIMGGRAFSLIDAGFLDDAERDMRWSQALALNSTGTNPTAFNSTGALELARGHREAAATSFRRAIEMAARVPNSAIPSPSYASGQHLQAALNLATIMEADGKRSEAIALLEEAGRRRRDLGTGALTSWMRSRAHLARLYRKNGQIREAEAVEAQLLKLLAVADPDYPLLKELEARRTRNQ
jgi:tetratricopeptide (TPR) repeat protein